jgi:pSer/pThr/pTyr-binding forkhead associated (FHA) protein
MDQISKIFGKKTGSSGPDDKSSKSEASPEQAFGLKFIYETGEERMFTALPISIGRGEHNDLVLNQETVSSEHALVYFDERVQDICIVDQDSLNGLFIDGLPTRKNVLHDGVKIQLGEVVLAFRDTGYIHSR